VKPISQMINHLARVGKEMLQRSSIESQNMQSDIPSEALPLADP